MGGSPVRLGAARIALGLIQGIALYFIEGSIDSRLESATAKFLFVPADIVVLSVPFIALFGLGNMRARTLFAWMSGATVLLSLLALHDRLRQSVDPGRSVLLAEHGPSTMLIGFVVLGGFIMQAMVTAGDADRRYIATYPRYFEAAWKLALQIAMTGVFVGLFWLLLWLGAGLLDLIEIRFLRRLTQDNAFVYPATAVAIAAAIHLTDVRADILSGARLLIQSILSWLLPLVVIFVGIFLLSLPFTGLHALWRTSHAAVLLLAVAGVTIALVNAVYRDGAAGGAASSILRIGAAVGVVELAPIVAIAAMAVALRVGQHGWTVSRVLAAAAVLIAACYAAGYLLALMRWGLGLRGLERANVVASFVTLFVLLALLTPVADPARIAVASQIALLKSGRVTADGFDYKYLRWQGERYGREALEALAADPAGDGAVRAGALKALASTGRWEHD